MHNRAFGSGKSTLLRCLNMLEMPDEGTVEVDGQTVTSENLQQMRTKMAMVFKIVISSAISPS